MSSFIPYEIDELKFMKKKPEKVFYKGNLDLLKKKKVSIVVTIKPNSYTKKFTHLLSSKLSQENICIVSGAAIGVDTIVHKAAGENNTIAVMANGLDIKYPRINSNMITNIEEKGLVLSTYEDGYKAKVYSFVQRNELVVALGDCLIVTQADLNSGSLHSVEFALKQKKKIYVLAHRCEESLGTNNLLKDNKAEVIYDVNDFLSKFTENRTNNYTKDTFLEYCKNTPSYNEAIQNYPEKLFQYELEGKIEVKNGFIYIL